jgi:hypothetical protein
VTQFLVEEALADIVEYQERLATARLGEPDEVVPASPHEQAGLDHERLMAAAKAG